MLDFADKLTRTPAAIEAADLEELRRQGFDDGAIHALALKTRVPEDR